MASPRKHVVVLVLGDVGRSPRMQYHALSVSQVESVDKVSLVGYRGERVLPSISSNNKIQVHSIHIPENHWLRKINILHALWKGLALVFAIFQTLLSLPPYQLILIQNPPSIPAVLVALLISWWNKSEIVVDWHNLGFSVYQERLGPKHVLVKLSRFLEHFLCSRASYHLCVSKALRNWLRDNFSVKAEVFYDRPAEIFQANGLSPSDRHELLTKLSLCDHLLFPALKTSKGEGKETIQTKTVKDSVAVRTEVNRTALVMSATSWTADEDFTLLLNALLTVEGYLAEHQTEAKQWIFCRVLCIITGKGEMKAAFEQQVAKYEQEGKLGQFVIVRTKWLETEDYPKLMSCADLGISLHTSTSGLDLPMKVLDMFGCGVPVCAVDFFTLSELLKHGVNGMVFGNQGELASQLIQLLFNAENGLLLKLKENASQIEHWDEQWTSVVKPYLFA